MSVGKQMKSYEDMKYEQWKEQVEQVLPSLLKRNLLIKPSEKHAQQTQLQQHGHGDDHGDDEGKERVLYYMVKCRYRPLSGCI